MKVVQVCAVDFTAYHLLAPLLRGCRDAGWTALFACADGPLAARLREEGFAHLPVHIPRSISPFQLARATLELADHLRRERPDIVHTHTPVGGIVGRAAARLTGGVRVAHTFHGLPFLEDEPHGVAERAFLVVERFLARGTDLFFSQAAGDCPRALKLGIARASDTVVIGNGVDTHRFRPDGEIRARLRARLGIRPGDVVVISVARLVREKGMLELADAALRIANPRVHVFLVGSALSSDRSDVSVQLDVHPVTASFGPRWRRLGYQTDVAELLQASDIFVLATYREGLPRSVIEAMAVGLPVVASDIPACRELVSDEVGLLFPVRDVSALTAALESLIDDPPRREAMGRAARARAVATHDERLIVARQVELLAQLARG